MDDITREEAIEFLDEVLARFNFVISVISSLPDGNIILNGTNRPLKQSDFFKDTVSRIDMIKARLNESSSG